MLPVKHRLFSLLAGLSLPLCVATVGLWARSYWVEDYHILNKARWGRYFVDSHDGSVLVWKYLDISPSTGQISLASAFPAFFLPDFVATVFFAILPGILVVHRFRSARHKKPAGVCSICGYDLRATPERCPECGTSSEPVPTPKLPLSK
jgi:hypothetical protein